MTGKQREYTEFTAPLKDTFNELRAYLDQQLSYNKLVLSKKIGEFSSYFVLLMILVSLGFLVLFFLSFGFVWWFSKVYPGSMYIGFLIVAGFYAFIASVVFTAREALIFKPIRKMFGNILYSDSSSVVKRETFESAEMLDAKIIFAKESLLNHEKQLAKSINGLGDVYTLKNIGFQAFQTSYNTFVSALSMAKMGFKFAQTIKRKFWDRRKPKKAERIEPESRKMQN
ncbi:MAG: hypothetical protein GXO88_02065 [Chlorobi bacterium]|nr:hypothetical protein [Chlorobiota bacterium]